LLTADCKARYAPAVRIAQCEGRYPAPSRPTMGQ
jgi:hypothetical protein